MKQTLPCKTIIQKLEEIIIKQLTSHNKNEVTEMNAVVE